MPAKIIKARRIHDDPFDPQRDKIDKNRIRVAKEINITAMQALLRLEDRCELCLEPETAVFRWRNFRSRRLRFFPNGDIGFECRPSIKLWLDVVELHQFRTHLRTFAIDASGQVWSWRYYRDWEYREDIILPFPLGDVTRCCFRTELLSGELLPALQKLGND